MTKAPQHGNGMSVPNALLGMIASAVPPAFTVPVLAFKAFIPSLTGVFVLGLLLAAGVSFHITLSANQSWYRRVLENFGQGVLMFITCLAWLLIINETGANEIVNRFLLGNSVDDHTYLIRFIAGAIIVFRIAALGYQAPLRNANSKAKDRKEPREAHAKHA